MKNRKEISPPVPTDEKERLEALYNYAVLDTEFEEAFDSLTKLAAEICETPISLVSLIDSDRQWFKSRQGLNATETARDISFCQHAILEDEVYEVRDASQHELFKDNPLVLGDPNIRFYAGAPLKNPDGYNLGTLCVIDNQPKQLTTAQKQALETLAKQVVSLLELRLKTKVIEIKNNQLKESNTNLEEFAYVASHDLNAPLNKIRMSYEILLKELGGTLTEQQEHFFGAVLRSCDDMGKLIEDLLKYSKISRSSLIFEPVDLEELANDVISNLEADIIKSKAIIEKDSLPRVNGERIVLMQLFQNLLANAMKFKSISNPEIQIGFKDIGDFYQLHVSDNGIGISEDNLGKVFQAFARVHSKSEYPGSGIGLATCKKVIEQHGGTIWVESNIGQGSTFYFTLPKAQAE